MARMAAKQPPVQPGDYMTPDEVAAVLRKEVETLRSWRYRSIGPPFIKIGHQTVLYPRADFEAWLLAQKASA
jgi:hypothetical protein